MSCDTFHMLEKSDVRDLCVVCRICTNENYFWKREIQMLQQEECCGSRTGSRTINASVTKHLIMIDDDHSVVSLNGKLHKQKQTLLPKQKLSNLVDNETQTNLLRLFVKFPTVKDEERKSTLMTCS